MNDVTKIKDYTFAKYFENSDYNTFFSDIYNDQYGNALLSPLTKVKKEDLVDTIENEKYIKELITLLNLPNPIPTTVKALLSIPPVPIGTPPVTTPPVTTPPATTTPATTTSATTPAPPILKPKFLFDTEKLKDIDTARINLTNIKNHITNIITIINQQLTSSVFLSITNNINKINENVNNLKLIEPKLLTAKIDEYDKVILKYDWLKDTYKMSDEPKIEITETKEIAKLLHEINPASKISTPSGELTLDEVKDLAFRFGSTSKPTIFSQESVDKLKDDKNAQIFINLLETKIYPDTFYKKQICTTLKNIRERYQVGKPIYTKLETPECVTSHEEQKKEKAEKAAAAALLAKTTGK